MKINEEVKKLLKKIIKDLEEFKKDLEEEFSISKASIFENVYSKPNANVYLASFMRFISNHYHDIMDHGNYPFLQYVWHQGKTIRI